MSTWKQLYSVTLCMCIISHNEVQTCNWRNRRKNSVDWRETLNHMLWFDMMCAIHFCLVFLTQNRINLSFQGGKTTTEAQQQAFGQGELNNPVWQDKPTAMGMLHLLDFSVCAQWKKMLTYQTQFSLQLNVIIVMCVPFLLDFKTGCPTSLHTRLWFCWNNFVE